MRYVKAITRKAIKKNPIIKNTINRKAINGITAVCIGFTAFSDITCALDITTRGALYSEYTNNSFRTATDETAELEHNLEAGITLQGASNRYDGRLDYTVTGTYFDRDTFDDRTVLVGSSNLNLIVLPERFLWQFEHFQDNQEVNSRLADVPDNRDERTVVQTGPLFTFDPSPVDKINLSGRYVETLFEENANSDSERIVTSLSWLHRYSPIGSVSLVGGYSDVEFKESDFQYEQSRLGINFSGELKNGTYQLEGGRTEIERDGGDEFDGSYAIAQLDLLYGLNTFNASYNRELTDTSLGLSLSSDFDLDFPSGDTNFNQVDILESERLQVAYQRSEVFANAQVELRAYREEENYETRQNRETRVGAVGFASYRFSGRLRSEVEISYEEVDSGALLGVNEDKGLEVALVYNLTQSLSLRVGALYNQRDNNREPEREYESLGVLVGLYYNSN